MLNPKQMVMTMLSTVATLPALADDAPAIVLGEVPVQASESGPLAPSQILTSVDILTADKIQQQNVSNSWELVGRLPGIQLTETRMGAESGKATFRAFNGEGYINGIKVLIDGIPSNVNSGNQRFIDMIFPLETEFIEVVRGTNDPRYGLHNIGGNINIGTRQGGNYTKGRFTYGSYATRELQLALGRESNGFAQNYFIAKQQSNGYRGHSDSDKYTLAGKWFMTAANGTVKAGLVARLYGHDADEPGFMTAEEMAQDRRQTFDKNGNDGDERHMKHVSAHVDWEVTPNLFLGNKLYFNRYEDNRHVTFTGSDAASLNNLPRQRRIWSEDQTGWLGTATWHAMPQLTLEGGLNTERQRNRYQRYRYAYAVPTDFNSTPTAISNDDHHTLNNVGAYVQAIIKPLPDLKIIPGFRADRFTGKTRLNNGVQGPLQDYGWIHQPKFSVIYNLRPGASVYANWGRTFQILTGSRAPAYLTSSTIEHFKPSINTGTEVGVKLKPAPNTDVRIAVWRQNATDEVANMPSTGTTVGLGQTRREGIDLQASTRLNKQWTLWASHSIQKAKVIKAYSSSGESLAGKEVFATPRHISNVGVDYQASDKWRFGLQGRSQGSYYIDDMNAKGKFGSFVLFDASAGYQLSKSISIDLQVKNLANRKYAYVWYDNFFWPSGSEQASFSPGNGRSAYLSLNFKL